MRWSEVILSHYLYFNINFIHRIQGGYTDTRRRFRACIDFFSSAFSTHLKKQCKLVIHLYQDVKKSDCSLKVVEWERLRVAMLTILMSVTDLLNCVNCTYDMASLHVQIAGSTCSYTSAAQATFPVTQTTLASFHRWLEEILLRTHKCNDTSMFPSGLSNQIASRLTIFALSRSPPSPTVSASLKIINKARVNSALLV